MLTTMQYLYVILLPYEDVFKIYFVFGFLYFKIDYYNNLYLIHRNRKHLYVILLSVGVLNNNN